MSLIDFCAGRLATGFIALVAVSLLAGCSATTSSDPDPEPTTTLSAEVVAVDDQFAEVHGDFVTSMSDVQALISDHPNNECLLTLQVTIFDNFSELLTDVRPQMVELKATDGESADLLAEVKATLDDLAAANESDTAAFKNCSVD